jgi:aldose 1-epimerase
VYRPGHGPALCFEPITHPIDAFHLPGRPGLRVLAQGETLRLHVQWRLEDA